VAPSLLSEWESFYVITGSSGAALTGLMFVVVALAAERMSGRSNAEGMAGFSTPTVIHFGMVLLVASIMTMPRHGLASLRISLAACAIAGLGSTHVFGVARMRKVTAYVPVTEDWLWYAILPCVAYVALLAGAVVLGMAQDFALYVVSAVVLALLYIGIHNAWDAAMYVAVYTHPDGEG